MLVCVLTPKRRWGVNLLSPCWWWPFLQTTCTGFGCTGPRSASGRLLEDTERTEVNKELLQGNKSAFTRSLLLFYYNICGTHGANPLTTSRGSSQITQGLTWTWTCWRVYIWIYWKAFTTNVPNCVLDWIKKEKKTLAFMSLTAETPFCPHRCTFLGQTWNCYF